MKLLTASLSSTGLILALVVCVCFIVLGAYMGSQGRGDVPFDQSPINISADVEKYREKVTVECIKNDIPEAVNLLLAMIMRESGGLVPDVMQSSESLGLAPNSIQDPNLSIEVGVKYFANGYKYAREHATKNIEETALQGYNCAKRS